MSEKINAILMLEVLGKPKEYVKETLGKIIEMLGKEKDVKIINKNLAEPKKIKQQEEVFTSFAEVEIETFLDKLMMIIFAYMPSHIDIITPEELKINNFDLNMFFNELLRKLHQYDELTKTLMIEREIITKQIQEKIEEGKIKMENINSFKPKKSKAFLDPENQKFSRKRIKISKNKKKVRKKR